MKKKYVKLLFFIYMILLLVFVVFKFNGSFYSMLDRIRSFQRGRANGAWNCNLVLFRTIGAQLYDIDNFWALKNLAANILAFLPFGFFLPAVTSKIKNIGMFLLISLLFILIIESVQFVTLLGSFDIDDILLNTIGCILGYGCYKLYIKKCCAK